MLISNLSRLDKTSLTHQDGVEATLNILDHLLELYPEWVLFAFSFLPSATPFYFIVIILFTYRMISTYWKAELFQQLLSRLDVDIYNDVSLHCSELLFLMVGVADQVDSLAS